MELTHCTVTETSWFYVHEIDLEKKRQLITFLRTFLKSDLIVGLYSIQNAKIKSQKIIFKSLKSIHSKK